MDERLRIREIYRSIQGESTFAGWPCAFVRTAGCDIRCVYCDEPEALTAAGSPTMTIEEILRRVKELGVALVEVTGGEPLLQRAAPELVRRLCSAGYEVLVETGGHHDISPLDLRCHAIVDVKTPGSGMVSRNDLANLDRLRPGDEVKLVLTGRADYEWARDLVRRTDLTSRAPVHFSPCFGALDPRDLAGWILEDGLRVRLNLQIHKWIWGPDARGV
jgi:7-carboxy-7-deazaguanine synthase